MTGTHTGRDLRPCSSLIHFGRSRDRLARRCWSSMRPPTTLKPPARTSHGCQGNWTSAARVRDFRWSFARRRDQPISRFDRSIESLASFLTEPDLPRIGMCWDVAHDWESGGRITALTRHGRCTGSTTCTSTTVAPMPRCMRPSTRGSVPWREAVAALKDVGWQARLRSKSGIVMLPSWASHGTCSRQACAHFDRFWLGSK